MFYIHGNILLDGAWPKDLILAVGTVFLSDDFRKVFGHDSIAGETGGQTYVITGRGGLVLSDLFNACEYLHRRVQVNHERSCSCLLKSMYENDLSISFKLSARDMHMDNLSDIYSCDVRVTSDGEKFLVQRMQGYGYDVCDSLDGYSLTCLAAIAMHELYDLEFSELSACDAASVRCALYLDAVKFDLFNEILKLFRSVSSENFDQRAYEIFYDFFCENRDKIQSALDFVGVVK